MMKRVILTLSILTGVLLCDAQSKTDPPKPDSSRVPLAYVANHKTDSITFRISTGWVLKVQEKTWQYLQDANVAPGADSFTVKKTAVPSGLPIYFYRDTIGFKWVRIKWPLLEFTLPPKQ